MRRHKIRGSGDENGKHCTSNMITIAMFDQMFDGFQILPNTIKQHQTRWPKDKILGHQTFYV